MPIEMPATTRQRRPAVRLGASLVLALALVLPVFAAPASVGAAGAFSLNLAVKGDYVKQTNFVQCVGASMQMMINMIAPVDDHTAATQLRLQELARGLSGPNRQGRQRSGASVRGWTAGLNALGYGPYRLVGEPDLASALRTAARAIRVTGRPVGLLVWRGRHAWVMSGFQATADPALTDSYAVTAAYILDPLYPHGSAVWGPSPKPYAAQSLAQVGRQFVARRSNNSQSGVTGTPGSGTNPGSMSSLAGKWVLVLPTSPISHPQAERLH
jgi:hypothetical protein